MAVAGPGVRWEIVKGVLTGVNCRGATRGDGATARVGTVPPSLLAAWRTTIFTMPGLLTMEEDTGRGRRESSGEERHGSDPLDTLSLEGQGPSGEDMRTGRPPQRVKH